VFVGVGGHVEPGASSYAGWLLLRVRAIEDFRRMWKDVRVAEVCFAVVGGELRETQNQNAD
jgi:hypothetical protein